LSGKEEGLTDKIVAGEREKCDRERRTKCETGEGMNRRDRERKDRGVKGAARGKGNRRKEADSKTGSNSWRSKEKK
jgi:hypothetical protein